MPAIENQSQLVLSQNQFAFIQDSTKGVVQVYTGPHMVALNQTDRPVKYDRNAGRFVAIDLQAAITQSPSVAEGEYLVLSNPVLDKDGRLQKPTKGGETPPELLTGRKINIPGPATFALWPGQFAEAVSGHHLRSNQYLVVRVYNSDEAGRNATELLRSMAGLTTVEQFTPGQLIVIKGTEASFFIPPTGFEVLKDDDEKGSKTYVREALTLERLEYAILLDEDGNKRYERGPQVVFPAATEKFLTRKEEGGGSRKFKAIELNDQMGLYIKVIADYEEEVEPAAAVDGPLYRLETAEGGAVRAFRQYAAGEELFITGKEQRIYYPRPEHALIGYEDPKSNFKRERYYGITIPKGEGRYVLDKTVGDIQTVRGPQIFLPDPRNEVIVRRVLDAKAVGLWYPGNMEALTFNQSLASMTDEGTTFLTDSAVQSAMADLTRGINRMTASNVAYAAPAITRGTKFTPPPMLTLNNKYDGVPTINVWTGYAVQVVDRSGARRVVQGPATVLLEYDETLEMLTLSTGRPKTTDNLIHDVYLRVDHNLVSDEVSIETSDFVTVKVKVSYRVNFLREHQDRWFAVENYVKYLCDHMRSMLKARGKQTDVNTLIGNSAAIVRDCVLGVKAEYTGPDTGTANDGSATSVHRHRFFPENGMDVYDVEVLAVSIDDNAISNSLREAQRRAVQSAITLTADEQNLKNTQRKTAIQMELKTLEETAERHELTVTAETQAMRAANELKEIDAETTASRARQEGEAALQQVVDAIHAAELARRKADSEQTIAVQAAQVAQFKDRLAAIQPNLIKALLTIGEMGMQRELTAALAPLALHEQQGLSATMDRLFSGTMLEPLIKNLNRHQSVLAGSADDDL